MLFAQTKISLFSKYFVIWIIAAALGTYIRLYPLLNYVDHDISERASLLIISQVRNKVALQVEQNYAHLSKKEKSVLAKNLFDELIRKEGSQLRETIDKAALNIQKNSKNSKHPYFLASDSFYYYQLTKNIIETGKISSKIKGSKYFHELMLAPKGHWEPFNLHPYVGLFIYKIQTLFNPNQGLMYALSFTPILISILSLIPFLLICHFLRCKPLLSFISSLFYTLSPILVKRSTFGWYDNDPYSHLFSLSVLALFFLGLQPLKNTKTFDARTISPSKIKTNNNLIHYPKAFLAALGTSVFIMLYALFWQGWVFFFAIIVCSSLLIIIHNAFISRKSCNPKGLQQYLALSVIGGFILISLIFGLNEFFVLFAEGWAALKNFISPQLSLWPDIYISVGELHKSTFAYIIEHSGGIFFFAVSVIGFINTLFKQNPSCKENLFYEKIVIGVFFVLSFYITLGAQRFLLLCLVPMSLLFALGLQFLYQHLLILVTRWSKPGQTKHKTIQILLTLSFLLLSFIPYYRISGMMKSLLNPIYNDTWHKALVEIKEKTPPNSIINTWWPPGHFIKATAERAVTFDGATINMPQAYWMANVFLSNTEEEALGLLRMLNTSGNDAADFLHKELGLPLSTSVQVLKEITPKPKEEARFLLNKGLSPKKTEHLLSLTHMLPPPSYCLIYKEFVDSNLQLGFFGKWNFRAIEEINKKPELLKKIPKKSSKGYIDFIWNLVGGQFKYSDPLPLINKRESHLFFQGNVNIDTDTMDCSIASSKYGQGVPQNIFYLENNTFTEKKFPQGNLPFSVVFYKQEDTPQVILLDERLAKSLLIRLYFFEGKGLRYFRPFSRTSDLTGRTKIFVYAIDWKKFTEDIQKQK